MTHLGPPKQKEATSTCPPSFAFQPDTCDSCPLTNKRTTRPWSSRQPNGQWNSSSSQTTREEMRISTTIESEQFLPRPFKQHAASLQKKPSFFRHLSTPDLLLHHGWPHARHIRYPLSRQSAHRRHKGYPQRPPQGRGPAYPPRTTSPCPATTCRAIGAKPPEGYTSSQALPETATMPPLTGTYTILPPRREEPPPTPHQWIPKYIPEK